MKWTVNWYKIFKIILNSFRNYGNVIKGMQGGYKKKYEIEQDRDSDWTVAADDTSRSFALCNYM